MDELKQQFYEVMHKYQKPFSEEGVTANLTQWSEQKQGLLQLLRRHEFHVSLKPFFTKVAKCKQTNASVTLCFETMPLTGH